MRHSAIICCLMICCIFPAYATTGKIYNSISLSAQFGMQIVYIKGGSLNNYLGMPNYASNNQKGFAGRYAIGFYLSHYFSIEIGYLLLHRYSTQIDIKTIIGDATGSVDRELSGYDIIANGFIPIHHFFLRIGAGPAIIDGDYLPVSLNFDGMVFPDDLGGSNHEKFVRPKLILGCGYMVNKNFLLSVNYSRIFHIGKSLPQDITLYLPNIDMLTIGISIVFP